MKVPLLDLKAEYAELKGEILPALERVCEKSAFVLGEEVEAFEREFADYCGTRHCVAVSSGTAALHLGLLALGVQEGDEVITSPNTFIATAETITYCGARPVFVDIDPATANLDPNLIERAITKRTRAIVPVHLYGRPADMDAIRAIATKHNLRVWKMRRRRTARDIEDAALGAWGKLQRSVFIRRRTWALMARAALLRPTMTRSRNSLAPRARTGKRRAMNTSSSATAIACTDLPALCCA